MRSNNTLSLLLIPLVAACIGETADAEADATTPSIDSAVAACDCPAPSAALVGFDSDMSGIEADNVQDAIDEVSMSIPTPVDIASRISVQTTTRSDLLGPTAAFGAGCGGSEGDFLALGGSCDGDGDGMTLYSTRLNGGSFLCRWDKVGAQPSTATATVTCLDLRP